MAGSAGILLARYAVGSTVPPATPPNILFIITDDQRREDFNFLPEGKTSDGRPKNLTPHIDRLSSEGVIFSRQYVSTSVCTPSRYACLTGRYASRAQNERFLAQRNKSNQLVVEWNTHIIPTDRTLPKMLQDAGYITGAVGKNHVIDTPGIPRIPKDVDPTDPDVDALLKKRQAAIIAAYKKCGFDYAASIVNSNLPGTTCRALQQHNMDWITQGALDFIDQTGDRPFFLYMATTLNHGPVPMGRKYTGDPRITTAGLLKEPLKVQPSRASIKKRIDEAGLPEDRAADNLWLDDGIGAVLRKLEDTRRLDNTIIFYFDDHGVEAGKGTCYEGGVRTPAFVWGKQIKGKRVVNVPVSNIDFAPTILDLCGVSYDREQFDGKSFQSLLEGGSGRIHDALYFEIGCCRAVLKDNWKYLALRYPEYMTNMSFDERKAALDRYNRGPNREKKEPHNTDPNSPFGHIGLPPGGRGSEQPAIRHFKHYFDVDQLYNLDTDPGEQQNLAADPRYRKKLGEMQALLAKLLERLPGTFGEFKTG